MYKEIREEGLSCSPGQRSPTVLVYGAGGLGFEVVKDLIMKGVRNITFHNDEVFKFEDLSSAANHFLAECNVGQSKSKFQHLETDKFGLVYTHRGEVSEEFLKQFQAIVITELPLHEQCRIGEIAHNNAISFVAADTKGPFGQLFVDFGKNYVLYEEKKEPVSAMIKHITKGKDAVVECFDATGFQDGDYVTFSDVEGMVQLNGCEPRKIEVLGTSIFKIGDTSNFDEYINGGAAIALRIRDVLNFKSLRESIKDPQIIMVDFVDLESPPQMHIAFHALHLFKELHNRFPAESKKDVMTFMSIANDLNGQSKNPLHLDENLFLKFASGVEKKNYLLQMVISGLAVLQVMKALNPLHMKCPLDQWLYFVK